MRIRNLVLKHPTFARVAGLTCGTRLRHPLGNVETFRLSPGFRFVVRDDVDVNRRTAARREEKCGDSGERIRDLVLKHPTFARTSGRTWGTRLCHPLGNVETFRLSPGSHATTA